MTPSRSEATVEYTKFHRDLERECPVDFAAARRSWRHGPTREESTMHRLVTACALLIATAAGAHAAATHTPSTKPAKATAQATGPQVAVLETAQGTIVVKLDEKDAPKTTANFKKLVREKFFDGTYFHRV